LAPNTAHYHIYIYIYIEKGNYKIALTKALKAIELFEEINNLTRKADALKQVGDIETALGNNTSALKYYENAFKIYDDFDDITYMAYTANSIGIVYKELNDFANAKKYQNMGVSFAREVNDKMSLSNALHNLGELFLIEKNYKKASELLTEAKEISEKENIPQSIINAYNGLAKVDYGLNKPNNALNKIDKAIAIAKPIGALPQLKELYAYRSLLLEKVNKNKEAIFYLKESQKLHDSIFSLKESQQIEELKTIYETEKKEAEITLQEQEIDALNTKAKNDKLTISLYSIGMFSVLAIEDYYILGLNNV